MRTSSHIRARTRPVQSWYLDATLLSGYYGADRVYHHTAPISSVLALCEALRRVDEEGLEARFARHRAAGEALVASLAPLGFEPLVADEHRLPMLTSLRLPDAVVRAGESQLRGRLLERHGIEVGGGLGKLAGTIWRVGLMGENARVESVEALRGALEGELASS